MTKTYKPRAGFTLMELLIVLTILIALLALLVPTVFNQQKRQNVQRAQIKISQLEGELELYLAENNGYPTNEQGLYALLYIPDNVGVLPTIQPGGPMGPGTAGTDPSVYGGMAGGSASIGPESLMTPQADPMAVTGTTMTGGMDPTTGMQMPDPMGTGGMASTWNQYVHNPQIYQQQRKRSTPYTASEKNLTDPWGQPYRYDNSQQFYGFNQTGSAKPAIWSAGPDKQDGTDDDIRNWDPVEAQRAIALRQQQMQGGTMGNGMDGNMSTIDPTGGGGMMQPGMTQPGMMQPGMTQPGMTQPGMTQPGMTQPGMTQPSMMQPGMTQPSMMQSGVPTPPPGM